MIDFDLEMNNIQPINMNSMQLKRYKVSSNIVNSIILYNKAIADIKIKNLDLAIKDLKKSLSCNPGFAEAMKLLGLCYVNNKEYRRAEKIFNKMVKHEIYSELAKEYKKGLAIEKNVSKTMVAIRRVKDRCDDGKKRHNISKQSRRKVVMGCAILTILAVVFIIIHSSPSVLEAFAAKAQTDDKTINSEDKADENSEMNKTSSDISNEEYENMQKN